MKTRLTIELVEWMKEEQGLKRTMAVEMTQSEST